MEVSGQLHDPAALPPEKEPLVPTGYEAGYLGCVSFITGRNTRNINENQMNMALNFLISDNSRESM
jgi:hypothetical protein